MMVVESRQNGGDFFLQPASGAEEAFERRRFSLTDDGV